MLQEGETLKKTTDEAVEPAPEKDARADKKKAFSRSVLLLLRDIAIAFVVIIIVLQFIRPTIVFEHSMEDTLHPEDYVFLARQAYLFNDVEFGDIVVFESLLLDENGRSKNLIKRVIGLPGDVIEVKNDYVYRNGELLIETYTKDGLTIGDIPAVTVPEDSYYVMGDNRQVSKDSRNSSVGFVAEDKIKGKVFFRLFPISNIGLLE